MNITPSANKVTFDKLESALAAGKQVANITEAAMDRQFVEQSRHDWCWLGCEDVPRESGWYEIDREDRRLIKISDERASELEWHERLFIYGSAVAAAMENSPLALYIGDEYEDKRLSALYLCGPDVLASVAQK